MTSLAPDYTERRGRRVLMVWGDLPFWTIVDPQAARFIEELAAGRDHDAALEHVTGGAPDAGLRRDAAALVSQLKRAGVIGGRRLPLPKELIESVSVNVTNRCNLRCGFCYNRARDGGGPEVSAREMTSAVDGLGRRLANGAALALLGGEPLLEREKTLELATWATRRGLKPIVSTNGLLVDADFGLRAAEVGLECQVSIDGATARSHDAIRGEGAFAQATAAARVLVQSGAHTMISMVCHSGNIEEVPAYLRLARELGVNEARVIPLKKMHHGTGLERPDLMRLLRLTVAALRKEPHLAPLLGRDYVSLLAGTCRQCGRRQSCGAGSQTLLIDADGTVYPCINLAGPEFAAGNVRERSVRAIVPGSDVLARVRDAIGLPGRADCAGCFVRHWCMGVCRGETYANTGSLSARSVTCEMNRATILETLWLLGEMPEIGRGAHQRHVG